ncbi:ATP-binding protein [Actinomadura sp. K4S16]|uniref:ATP-binding protein n=1 Tax=Actinomadura sp. K4S16 TaxID=1316147 RepID=UPI00135896D9|nr:ATP-binding protein [Actinomadura sp. K4S16]
MPVQTEIVPDPDNGESIITGVWPAEESSVRLARAWMRDWLEAHPGFDLDEVSLLLSEVLTNSLQHSRAGHRPDSRVRLNASCGSRLRFEVTDEGGDTLPAPRCPDPSELGGRGLLIVDALAAAWGYKTDPETGACTVWVEMDREPADGPDAGARAAEDESAAWCLGLA